MIDNSQHFIHYEAPGSKEMIRNQSYQKWYSVSNLLRFDHPKKIKISEISWSEMWRIGSIFNTKS